MRRNVLQTERLQMAIRRMRFACCITEVTNTYSEYVILGTTLYEQCVVLLYTKSADTNVYLKEGDVPPI